VATTTKKEDEKIYSLAKDWGFKSYRGSEEDVLDRFYQAAKPLNPAWIVRVTSDCPLLDPKLVDEIVAFAWKEKADYVSNIIESRYPDGQDVELFTFSSLEKAWADADKRSEREHVTPYIRNHSDMMGGELFTSVKFPADHDYSQIRMTVDEPEDFELIKKIINELGTDLTWKEYTNYIIENNLGSVNQHIQRNEGYLKSIKED
jgi:spore coat polysaccharide biosynthesis protein SpsF (cytidylyltransferase family)